VSRTPGRSRPPRGAGPVRPEFGPSLPELLRPWLRRKAPRSRRALAIAAGVVLALAVLAIVVIARGNHYSRSSPIAFNFSYPGALRLVPAGPGEYVRLEQRRGGNVIQSFAAEPLRVNAYSGYPESELPVYAAAYVRRLALSTTGFVALGDGTTVVDGAAAYYVLYQLGTGSQTVYGHDYFLLARRSGTRRGVILVLRSTPAAGITSALAVGTTGPLYDVLNSFKLG
jgi:hypothetical protein